MGIEEEIKRIFKEKVRFTTFRNESEYRKVMEGLPEYFRAVVEFVEKREEGKKQLVEALEKISELNNKPISKSTETLFINRIATEALKQWRAK